LRSKKKLVLALIDGLTPSAFEAAVEGGRAQTLALLAANGRYRRAASAFPSLTPVCVSSIVTGAHPDVHHIPHLVWYHRGERRLVEYGSSFGAIRRAGMSRSIRDAILNMNGEHLAPEATTIFESLEDAGLVPAAVNIPCYRGRTPHRATIPGLTRVVLGPKRFFFYNLFESDATGAPLAVRNRAGGTVDDYAAAVGRWLVTRDGFDFLAYYLSDHDYLSHAFGPDGAQEGISRADRALGALVEAAGGPDEFLERYAVVLCSDHGQTRVDRAARLQEPLAYVQGTVVTASNRAGMVYRLEECLLDPHELARLLDAVPFVGAVAYLDGDLAVLRREGEEARFTSEGHVDGDSALLDYPDACARLWAALRNPNAGDLLVSAAPGYEFADLGGRHHAGGGSHGSLVAGDSEVPVLLVGVDGEPRSITELAPLVLAHFGVAAPVPAHA
jgi:type I phosphodiesterase/nucleotide pyrophosphatase